LQPATAASSLTTHLAPTQHLAAVRVFQVFSAICVIFAHGANDSAYAAGPLAGIYTVYKHGYLPNKVTPTVWVVFISASSMVIGLATYGYNVTRAMGTKMSKLSASRGFAAELSTATVILVASQCAPPAALLSLLCASACRGQCTCFIAAMAVPIAMTAGGVRTMPLFVARLDARPPLTAIIRGTARGSNVGNCARKSVVMTGWSIPGHVHSRPLCAAASTSAEPIWV
jgi:hypothetical protein